MSEHEHSCPSTPTCSFLTAAILQPGPLLSVTGGSSPLSTTRPGEWRLELAQIWLGTVRASSFFPALMAQECMPLPKPESPPTPQPGAQQQDWPSALACVLGSCSNELAGSTAPENAGPTWSLPGSIVARPACGYGLTLQPGGICGLWKGQATLLPRPIGLLAFTPWASYVIEQVLTGG